jgi:hypothetical protein
MRTVLAVVAFAFGAGVVLAQPAGPLAPTQPPAPVPPAPAPLSDGVVVSATLQQPAAEAVGLPGGKDVSQPLQPVGPEPLPKVEPPKVPEVVTLPEAKPIPPERVRGPLGPSWDALELLYWWPTRQPVPQLAFGSRTGTPVPGAPGMDLLVGGEALDTQPSAGGRFTFGYSVNTAETLGLEFTYFFLGTRSFHRHVSNHLPNSVQTFGLPYVNASTGASELFLLGRAGETHSFLTASTSVRVQGWEVNTVANVVDREAVKVNALMGWRYFMANEGLRLQQTQLRYHGPNGGAGGVVQTADQFDAHNRFHGGQLGLHTDIRQGVVFCELTAKIAFGQVYEVVKTEGATHILTPVFGGATLQSFGGSGIYVQPSNFGRSANGVFAVLPEGTFKFGFRLGETGRVYVGYSFLYLSDAVRPGDQIDRTLNPSQVPLASGAPPVYGGDRPARLFNRSDFWVQGLLIGLETRY